MSVAQGMAQKASDIREEVSKSVAAGVQAGNSAAENTFGNEADDESTLKEFGQMGGRFNMMVRGAVVLAVGVLIVGEIFGALPEQTGPFANASDAVENLTGQAFEIAPIVLIVAVATLILNFVRGL